jgi:hypothetical protein
MLVPAGGFGWVTGNRPTAGRGASECVLVLTVADERRVDELVERLGRPRLRLCSNRRNNLGDTQPHSPTRTDTSGK